MIVRIYSGDDGQSHFEDLNIPAGQEQTLALKAGADLTFRSAPDGHFSDWHNAPRRQYLIILSGKMKIVVGDRTVRTLEPGDMLVAEDLTGKGHTTRAVGGPRVTVSTPMPD